MTAAQFDPCRQWLGINAVDLADPRRVLGLLPTESDPLAVLRAADARLTLLKGIAPGPFDMARNALIKRVEEAREAVLAQIAAAPRPPVQVGTVFAMPPPPGGVAPPAVPAVATPTTCGTPVVPAVPTVPAPAEAAAWTNPPGGDSGGFVTIKTSPVYRQQSSSNGILLLAMAALVAAAGGLAWVRFRPREPVSKRETAAVIVKQPLGGDPEEKTASSSQGKRTRERDPDDTTSDDAVSTSSPPQRTPPMAQRQPEPEPEPEPEPAAPNDTTAEEIAPLLAEVLAALQEKQFDAASQAVKAADKKTAGGPAQARVASWNSLIDFAQGFDEYRRQALAAVKPGNEYDVDGRQVAVIESDEEKFIFRFSGKSKTVSSDKIPGGILMTIVTEWFDEKPANHLFLGAYHATKPEPDLAKARASWQRAEAGGADASLLLPLLEDPLLLKAAAEKSAEDE